VAKFQHFRVPQGIEDALTELSEAHPLGCGESANACLGLEGVTLSREVSHVEIEA
jgi:hypothetical protein